MSNHIITTSEAAELIGLRTATFYAKRTLLRALGFPEPLAWNRRRYARAQVDDWVAAQSGVADIDISGIEAAANNVSVHPSARGAVQRILAERGRRRAQERGNRNGEHQGAGAAGA